MGREPHIVLMERDPNQATRRCAAFAVAGIRSVVTDNELALLSAVGKNGIDLVLLCLPSEETVQADLPEILRKLNPAVYLPVVAVVQDAQKHRQELMASGADDVVDLRADDAHLLARLCLPLRIRELHERLATKQKQLEAVMTREHMLLKKLREDNAQLREQATTDPLTHLQNRRSFNELLEHEFNVAKRYGHPLSLLALDVDHFKVINDEYGHPSGDYVLKELAVILKQSVRASDIVARTGGEEFTLLLPRAGRDDARKFAQRIRKGSFARNFRVYGHDIHATVSLGAATYPEDAEITEPEMLVNFADQALLHAKETGRDRVVQFHQFDAEMRRRCRRRHLQIHQRACGRETCIQQTENPASADR
jgi:diguanylate cyclase (GGDEF)-like protein